MTAGPQRGFLTFIKRAHSTFCKSQFPILSNTSALSTIVESVVRFVVTHAAPRGFSCQARLA